MTGCWRYWRAAWARQATKRRGRRAARQPAAAPPWRRNSSGCNA
jgi:hypothetical protein